MRNNMFKGLVSIILTGLFISFLSNINISEGADENIVVAGTIVSVSTMTGQVVVRNEGGENVILVAGHEIDLTMYNEGDQVTVRSTKDGIIMSINKIK